MPETFTRWDAANYLKTEEDTRLYLASCAEEDPGDGSLIRLALADVARAGLGDGRSLAQRREGAGERGTSAR